MGPMLVWKCEDNGMNVFRCISKFEVCINARWLVLMFRCFLLMLQSHSSCDGHINLVGVGSAVSFMSMSFTKSEQSVGDGVWLGLGRGEPWLI